MDACRISSVGLLEDRVVANLVLPIQNEKCVHEFVGRSPIHQRHYGRFAQTSGSVLQSCRRYHICRAESTKNPKELA